MYSKTRVDVVDVVDAERVKVRDEEIAVIKRLLLIVLSIPTIVSSRLKVLR